MEVNVFSESAEMKHPPTPLPPTPAAITAPSLPVLGHGPWEEVGEEVAEEDAGTGEEIRDEEEEEEEEKDLSII